MGGRKTITYVVDTKAGAAGFAAAQRCLGDQLGGVIFGCTTETYKECIKDHVFGLPRSHMLYVRDIEPGLPLFLFNYNGRRLHGVFRSTSDGALNIKPHGWTGGTTVPTQFPAQVRVEVYKECESIHETKFRSILKSNYVSDDRHFVFELDKGQVKQLCKLFKCEVPKSLNAENLPRQSHPVGSGRAKPRIPLQIADSSSKSAWPQKLSPGQSSRDASSVNQDKQHEKQGNSVLNLDDFPALGGPQPPSMKGGNAAKKPLPGSSGSNRGDTSIADAEGSEGTSDAAMKQRNGCTVGAWSEIPGTMQEKVAGVRIVRALTGGEKSMPVSVLHVSGNVDNTSKQKQKQGPHGVLEVNHHVQETKMTNPKTPGGCWSASETRRKVTKAPPHIQIIQKAERLSKVTDAQGTKAPKKPKTDVSKSTMKPVEVAQASLPLESVFLKARISATQSVESMKSNAVLAEDSKSSMVMLEDVSEWTRTHQGLENSRSGRNTQEATWYPPGHPFCYRSNGVKADAHMHDEQVSNVSMHTEWEAKEATPGGKESEGLMELDEPDGQRTVQNTFFDQQGQTKRAGGTGPISTGPMDQRTCSDQAGPRALDKNFLVVSGRNQVVKKVQIEASILDDDRYMQDCIGELKTEIEAFPSESACSDSPDSCSIPVGLPSHRTSLSATASCSLVNLGACLAAPNGELEASWSYPSYDLGRKSGDAQHSSQLNAANQIPLSCDVEKSAPSGLSRLPIFSQECASTSSALSPPHLLFSEIEDRLFIVGGLNKSIMSSVELYDFKTSAWAPVSNLPFDKFLCGDASAIGAWLYVLRGEVDGNVSSSPSFCLNTVTGMWHTVAPSVTPRANMGMTTVNDKIVAIGGRSQKQSLASMEYYDPNTDRWFAGVEMSTPRYDAGVCAKDGVIYVCGGFDGNRFLRSVEALDPRVGYWQSLPDMSSVRGGVASEFCYGSLWVAGGDDGRGALNTVEAYDPRAATWTEAPSLCSARAYCTVEIVNERLYVIGGRRSKLSLGCLGMERFDPVKSCWVDGLSAGSSGTRCFHSSCVIQY